MLKMITRTGTVIIDLLNPVEPLIFVETAYPIPYIHSN